MNFLAPFFLVGALAVAGPILFHLIRRTTRDRTVFSSVMFLEPTPPRVTQRSRLDHWLLLVLRCLALALLAVGFARPFFRHSALPEASAAPVRRFVVLVDASASMRRTGLWDQARGRANAWVRSLGPTDEVAVALFSRTVSPLVSFEDWRAAPVSARAALVTDRLAAAGPGWGDDHLGEAVISAAEMLADNPRDSQGAGTREIVLISDLKAGSQLDALQGYDWPKGIHLRLQRLTSAKPTNAGLHLVATGPDADPQAARMVRVRVSNAADSTREQFRVGWSDRQGAALAPEVDVYVPPGQSRVVAVPLLPSRGAMRELRLRGDDEDFDNTVYVVPAEPQQWNVLFLGATAADDAHGPLFFLQRAVPANAELAVHVVASPPNLPLDAGAVQAAKAVFVTDPLPGASAALLRAQMLAGKTVVFAPADAGGAGTLAALLGRGAGEVPLEEVKPPDYAMFGEIDFRHPLFAPFADPHFSDFTKIHIWKYRRLAPSSVPGAHIIARFDHGDPALVEVPIGTGRLVILLTGWDPADSQWAVSSKFVPLIDALLELAAGPANDTSAFAVGDPLPLRPRTAEPTLVQLPDGKTVSVPAGTAAFTGDGAPGFYTLTTGPVSRQVAVNVAAAESRTEPLPLDELERYGAPDAAAAPNPALAAEQARLVEGAEAESRQKLWRWLLGGALAVLLAESVLAGWTQRRSERNLA